MGRSGGPTSNEGRNEVQFLKRYIFTRFGTPHALIGDEGSHFCNHMFSSLLRKSVVKHKVSTPYHQQTSGQVEVSDREIERDFGQKSLMQIEPIGLKS